MLNSAAANDFQRPSSATRASCMKSMVNVNLDSAQLSASMAHSPITVSRSAAATDPDRKASRYAAHCNFLRISRPSVIAQIPHRIIRKNLQGVIDGVRLQARAIFLFENFQKGGSHQVPAFHEVQPVLQPDSRRAGSRIHFFKTDAVHAGLTVDIEPAQ